ncbi:MAG: hypothetical protein GOVbin1782_20 [Prokaryotic dsDNA virus sp.]|nr:MAG: hypothetical protein GOVbin1782_20 [Prokaryotic dsDNA virus sp.]|tara:strand:+ start:14989 stop:15201 length:213 start_codon:yes stop_codon:yes gene_type:complete
MSEELMFPTLAIQLKNEKGIPYDMPDDWLETALMVANMIYQKYQVGVDVVYGSASREGFIILEKECHKNE